jgi:fructose-1-phosphate kinase PfkB-like protein
VAVYPAGGPFGDLLRRSLDELGLVHRSVSIAGDTRESFTVDELDSGLQYRFVLPVRRCLSRSCNAASTASRRCARRRPMWC